MQLETNCEIAWVCIGHTEIIEVDGRQTALFLLFEFSHAILTFCNFHPSSWPTFLEFNTLHNWIGTITLTCLCCFHQYHCECFKVACYCIHISVICNGPYYFDLGTNAVVQIQNKHPGKFNSCFYVLFMQWIHFATLLFRQ